MPTSLTPEPLPPEDPPDDPRVPTPLPTARGEATGETEGHGTDPSLYGQQRLLAATDLDDHPDEDADDDQGSPVGGDA